MNNALTKLGETLLDLAKKDRRIVVVSADLTESVRMSEFKKQLPNQFIDVGVAEQNMAGVASGLALAGKIPYIFSFAIFSPGINWLMIRDICISNLKVRIVGGQPGFATVQNGATHQTLEDIALMRILPKMTVLAPADANQAKIMIEKTVDHPGPIYFRASRIDTPSITHSEPHSFQIGHAQILKQGADVAIISIGPTLVTAIEAAKKLAASNIQARVINLHTLKPIDQQTIFDAFAQTKVVISVEDHQAAGGLGSAISEVISQTPSRTPFRIIAVEDQFGESGSVSELYHKHGLTAENIANTVTKILQ